MAKKKMKSKAVKVKSSNVKKIKLSNPVSASPSKKVMVSTKIKKLTWKDYLGLLFYAILILVILFGIIYLVKFQDNIVGWATQVKINQQISLAFGESAQYQVNGQIYDLMPIAENEDGTVITVYVAKNLPADNTDGGVER